MTREVRTSDADRGTHPDRTAELAGFSRDEILALARRIDWRFLFPNPALQSVGVVGKADRELLRALEVFSQELIVLDRETWNQGPPRTFDLLVVHGYTACSVRKMTQLLEQGGCLYWELERRLCHRPPVSLSGLANLLKKSGFEDVQVHWHRPNHWACLDIIPAEDSAVDEFLEGNVQGWRAVSKRWLARMLKRIVGFEALLTCTSVVARRGILS